MISDRVKRNISAICIVIGTVFVISRVWEVIISPKSGSAWFELSGSILILFICIDSYINYRRRIKKRATDFYRVSGSSISHIFTIRYSY